MTKSELIERLKDFNDDDVVIIAVDTSDGLGWSNIEGIRQEGSSIALMMELEPVFSEN